MRNHPAVDGVFQIMWIIAVTSLYQALWLEVGLLLYPIGFVLGVESLIIGVGDVIKRWNDEAEDCYLRKGQDAVLFFEDAEADEEDGQNGRSDDRSDRGERGDLNGEKEKLDEEHSLRDDGSPEPPNGEIVSILRKNGSLLQSQEISSSQQNFFRMLDQKIEEGPDYDSSSETEQALEEARLNALVQHWESASLTTSMCSSTSRSLQGTPVRQVPLR
uniref:Uncharacterized protein n=1 Tax=Anopheles culicifacies TaxID=139723 RepID=A0A182MMG2_9DIPT